MLLPTLSFVGAKTWGGPNWKPYSFNTPSHYHKLDDSQFSCFAEPHMCGINFIILLLRSTGDAATAILRPIHVSTRLVVYLLQCTQKILSSFITRLSSWEGWYRKSTNQIARLPVWYFPSIRPVPCVSDQKSNFSKWRMRRRSRFANFLLETQSNSCPGDEGLHFELGLDMWNNLGRPEEAAEHENGEVITNSSWASRFYRSHLAWSALVQRWIRQKNRNYCVNYSWMYKKSDEYNQFDFGNPRALNARCICRSRLFWH